MANLIILISKNGGKIHQKSQKFRGFFLFLKKNRQNTKIRPQKNAAGVLPIMQEGTHGLLHIVSNFATSACLVVTVAINFAFFPSFCPESGGSSSWLGLVGTYGNCSGIGSNSTYLCIPLDRFDLLLRGRRGGDFQGFCEISLSLSFLSPSLKKKKSFFLSSVMVGNGGIVGLETTT